MEFVGQDGAELLEAKETVRFGASKTAGRSRVEVGGRASSTGRAGRVCCGPSGVRPRPFVPARVGHARECCQRSASPNDPRLERGLDGAWFPRPQVHVFGISVPSSLSQV